MHLNCVQWFRKSYPDALAFHVPNGEYRHQHTADTLQRMGVSPGVADWLMFDKEHSMLAVELKAKNGAQSDEQKKFQRQWIDAGGGYAVACTLEDFQAICRRFLFLRFPTMPEAEPAPLQKMPWET